MGILRAFVNFNRELSAAFDRKFLPRIYLVDGNRDFVDDFVPQFLQAGMRIYDVGGGKRPFLSVARKQELNIHVTGLDIDASELSRAPAGAYDRTIAADIAVYRGDGDADLVICQALLEHVRDNAASFKALTSMLKAGGHLLIFVPSRNAVFARLNMILPEKWKRGLLFLIYPETRYAQGFPSFYDRCTPKDFAELGKRNGLALQTVRHYFVSSYFSFFFPLYLVWRLWIVLFRMLRGTQAAETFSMAFIKA
jgi:SAM-dependent methyltransferase